MRQQNRLLSSPRSWSSVLSLTFLLLALLLSLPLPRKNNNKKKGNKKHGAIRTEQGKLILSDGRKMISKTLMIGLLTYLHQGSHWGPQAIGDTILQAYGCIGIYVHTNQRWSHLSKNEQASPETETSWE
jgi:hypothetical protein